MGIQDGYVLGAPRAQDAVALFEGEWSSRLPAELGVEAGPVPLFDDDRLVWAVDALGGVGGQRVLELGPLEGGHTYGLLRAGAAAVTAVEASPRAWLRCLVAKELLELQGARFLLGGAESFLRADESRYDLGWCSGLLYHLRDPHSTLVRLAERCDALFVWTHVVEHEAIADRPELAAQFDGTTRTVDLGGRELTLHRHLYQDASSITSFCGGARPDSWWLGRSSLFAALEACGFGQHEVAFDEPRHPNGPSLALVARRTGPRVAAADLLPPGAGDGDTGEAPRLEAGGIAALPTPAEVAQLREQVAALQAALDTRAATPTPTPAPRSLASRLKRLLP